MVGMAGLCGLGERAVACGMQGAPDLGELEKALRNPWPDTRRRAVRKLVGVGSEKAWKLVLEALEDRDPQVADEAQLALAEIRMPRVMARLLGRDGLRGGKDRVRVRIAEALGRMNMSVEGVALVRVFDPREVELTRYALWSLERLVGTGHLIGDRDALARKVEGLLRPGRDPLLRADALAALEALSPKRAERHLRLGFEDREPEVRTAALVLWCAREAPDAFGIAERLAGDPNPRVRRTAIGELARFENRSALEVLVERLGQEPRRRLVERLVDVLQDLTGLRYRADPRPWQDVLRRLPADWRAEKPPVPEESSAGQRTISGLASLPLRSDRLCLLVDFSGSLWAERSEGRSRKELLDVEIRRLLESLPSDSEFNLMPYASQPQPWSDSLVRAKPQAVRAAAREFESCTLTGRGNFWDAALLAMDDPRVDTLVVVTDGAPTGGAHWNLDLMFELLVWESRWRPVAVDAVLVDASPRLRKHWASLAERTGGTCTSVEFGASEAGER